MISHQKALMELNKSAWQALRASKAPDASKEERATLLRIATDTDKLLDDRIGRKT